EFRLNLYRNATRCNRAGAGVILNPHSRPLLLTYFILVITMATKHHLFILLLFFSTICVSQEIKKHTVSAPVYQLGKELKNLINTEMDACLIDKDIDYSKMHHRLQIDNHNDSLIVHLNTGIRIIVDTEAEWGTLNITGLAVY